MARIFLAIATALFATTSLLGTPAEACISCEYTPEVVNTPNPNARGKLPKRHQAKQKQKQRSPAKSHTARKTPAARAKAQQAKSAPAAARVPGVAKVEPATGSEPAPETAATAPAETGPRLTGSSALMQRSIPQKDEPDPEPVAAAEAEQACKKFVPAVGAMVSVPCE